MNLQKYSSDFANHTVVDLTDLLENSLKRLGEFQLKNGPDTCWVHVKLLPDNHGQEKLLRLIELLPRYANCEVLAIQVDAGAPMKLFLERQMLRQIADAPFQVQWSYLAYENVEKISLELGQLYYLSEVGACSFEFDYDHNLTKSIRENGVPWTLFFKDITVQHNEIPSDQIIPEPAVRSPAVVRYGRIQRALQWIVRQVSRLRSVRDTSHPRGS